MSSNGRKALQEQAKDSEHKTIRGDTRIARIRRARVWALVRLKDMAPADAYRSVLRSGKSENPEAQGTAMVEAFEAEAGDNLEEALTAADLGMARLLREIDSSLKSDKPQTYNAALRLLADLHKRPTITAPAVAPVMIEKGVVVVPREMSPDDWTKQTRSAK